MHSFNKGQDARILIILLSGPPDWCHWDGHGRHWEVHRNLQRQNWTPSLESEGRGVGHKKVVPVKRLNFKFTGFGQAGHLPQPDLLLKSLTMWKVYFLYKWSACYGCAPESSHPTSFLGVWSIAVDISSYSHLTGLLLHLDSLQMWRCGKWSFHAAEISKRLPEHSTWQVWSAFISIHIGKLLLRPQEWCLQLRFQCRQWENGDGKIIPHLVILFLVQVSKDGSWKVFDTAIQFSRGQDAEVNSGNCLKCLILQ